MTQPSLHPKPSAHRRPSSLLDRVVGRGWEFDFFQAVWLLERFGARGVPVGERGPVSGERFRFRPAVAMGFPATDVRRIRAEEEAAEEGPIYHVDVTFMGLYGVSTPLPLHYAVDVLRSVDESPSEAVSGSTTPLSAGDTKPVGWSPLRDFLDVFDHRLISFFYRSWLKYRFERSFALSGRDVVSRYLRWFIGCSPNVETQTLGVSPIRLIRYAGILTQRPRSAVMLRGLLRDYWDDPTVQVEPCVGRWVDIARVYQNRLGVANSRLGDDLTIGEQIFDLSGTFLLRVGPMDWPRYLSFVPDGARAEQTRALIKYFCQDPLACTFELRIRAGEVPALRLESGESGSRLGYTSWLRMGPLPEVSVRFEDATPIGRPAGPAFASTAKVA